MKRVWVWIALAGLIVVIGTAPAGAEPKAGWPKSVTVGAAPVGGTYFIWAGGFTKLLNDKMGIPGNVESTGGPVHNVQLIEDNKLDFGMVTNGPAWRGLERRGLGQGQEVSEPAGHLPHVHHLLSDVLPEKDRHQEHHGP